MEVTVKRSGGIGAPATDKEWGPYDTSASSDGTEIEDLVRDTNFFGLAAEFAPRGPDQVRSEVTVKDGERSHTVSFSELNADVPTGLNQMVSAVQAACGGE